MSVCACSLRLRTAVLSVLFPVLISGCATWKTGKSGQRKINGKTYVIIGASSGFGRGMAEELGRYKANVVVAARRTDLLNEITAGINAAGGHAIAVTMDISTPQDLQRVLDTTLRVFGKIDCWVNMVGVGAIGKFWDIPVQDQARIIDVNFKGFVYGTHVAVQQFRKQGYGTLINMGSVDSETPLAYQATYAATKAAVRSMSLALGQELRRNGSRITLLLTSRNGFPLRWRINTRSKTPPLLLLQRALSTILWMAAEVSTMA